MIALSGTLLKELKNKKDSRGQIDKLVDKQWDVFLDQLENNGKIEPSSVQKCENGV